MHVAVGGFFPRSRKYCIETDGGGGIFIYLCTDLKNNQLESKLIAQNRIYEY